MSVVRVNQIQDTSTNVAANISGGVVTFTNPPAFASGADPFNSVIETFYYGSGDHVEANNADLDQGWTSRTTDNTAYKNGGMTQSSGIWTFPSTGIWNVTLSFAFYDNQASNSSGVLLLHSSDSGSNFVAVHGGYQNTRAANAHANMVLTYTFNIANTSTQRILFRITSGGNLNVRGGSSWTATKAQFIKLCPSV